MSQEQQITRSVGVWRRIWRMALAGVLLVALAGAAFVAGAGWLYAVGLEVVSELPPGVRALLPPPALPPGPPPAVQAGSPDVISVPSGPVSAPDRAVTIRAQVSGGVDALAVHVQPGGGVLGSVRARERAEVQGTVSGSVTAPVVIIGEERFARAGSVQGGLDGRVVVVHRGSAVTGPVTAAETAEIGGRVTGDIRAPRVVLHAGAAVTGDVTVTGGQLVLTPGAVLNGALRGPAAGVTVQALPAATAGDARLGPNLPAPLQVPVAVHPNQRTVYVDRGGGPLGVALAGLALVLGLVAMTSLGRVFADTPVQEVAVALERRLWRSVVLGVWTVLLVGVLGVVLTVTVIGAPLALALGLTTAAALILGAAAVSDVAGTRLLAALGKSGGPPLLRTMAGAAGLGLLLFVPVLGWLLLAAAALAGLGASAGIWYPRLAPAWRHWRDRRRAGNPGGGHSDGGPGSGDDPGHPGGGGGSSDDGPNPGGA